MASIPVSAFLLGETASHQAEEAQPSSQQWQAPGRDSELPTSGGFLSGRCGAENPTEGTGQKDVLSVMQTV